MGSGSVEQGSGIGTGPGGAAVGRSTCKNGWGLGLGGTGTRPWLARLFSTVTGLRVGGLEVTSTLDLTRRTRRRGNPPPTPLPSSDVLSAGSGILDKLAERTRSHAHMWLPRAPGGLVWSVGQDPSLVGCWARERG